MLVTKFVSKRLGVTFPPPDPEQAASPAPLPPPQLSPPPAPFHSSELELTIFLINLQDLGCAGELAALRALQA